MRDPVAAWHQEHEFFERLLALLESELAAFHGGKSPNYGLMLDIVTYLRHYPDRMHHPREDATFDFLLRHDPSLRRQIEHLRAEHHQIAAAGDTLLVTLNEIADGAMLAREQLETDVRAYLALYRQHLEAEESGVMPRARELLTAKEWDAAAAAVPGVPDPVFGEDFEARYRELRRQIALSA
jgi:hemerythrin-like domain-containing protein